MKNRDIILIISVFLILTLIGYLHHSFFGSGKMKNDVTTEELELSIRRIQQELRGFDGLRPDTLMVSYLRDRLNFIDDWIFNNGKFFLSEDNSTITWDYLRSIGNHINPEFQFDFTVVNRSGEFDYTISGIGNTNDVYALISHLEKLGALYTIENVVINSSLQESDKGPPINYVSYNILIRPWVDRAIGLRLNEQPFRDIEITPLLSDPMEANTSLM